MRGLRMFWVLALAVPAAVAFAGSASAATLEVTRADDPVPGACTASDCSLREAVRRANATVASDRIVLRKRTYGLSQAPAGDDEALSGDLDVIAGSGKLTVVGKGRGKTTIDGNDLDRILEVFEGARASLRGLTLKDGVSSTGAGIQNQGSLAIRKAALRSGESLIGGGIYNYGPARLTVERTVFTGNTASSGAGIHNEDEASAALNRTVFRNNEATSQGGGLYSQDGATAKLTRTVFRNNEAGVSGGGIYSQDEARLTVTKSTIERNEALGDGAGLYNQNDARATIKASTISGNTAVDEGGGIYTQNDSFLTLVNTTLSGNRADEGGGIYANNWPYIRINFSTIARNTAVTTGGAIFDFTSDINLLRPPPFWLMRGTIVAKNSSAGVDNCLVDDPINFDSQGSNLDDEDTCLFTRGSDQRNATAGLRKLAKNGGPTKTHALKPSSDAVNAARKQGCPGRDQRGIKRPQGNRCDSGSYELKKR